MFRKRKAQKNPFLDAGDSISYTNGSGKYITTTVMQRYLETNNQINTVVDTFTQVASGASLKWYKEDTKGKLKPFKFKQIDPFMMNDFQSTEDFIRQAIGTMETYKQLLIIPETNTSGTRKGKIDFYIAPPNNYELVTGDKRTIEQIKYKSTNGTDTLYNHSDIIFCVMNPTAQNLIYAPSKLKVLNDTIQRIIKINTYTDNYLSSGGKDAVIIGNDDIMSAEQQQEIKKEVDRFVKDHNKKALMLNTEKLSVSSISGNLSTANVVEFMTKLNKEILQSYKMPRFMLGDYDVSTNEDTIKQAVRLWFEVALKPLFKTLESHLTSYCRNVLKVNNIICKFDYENINILEDDSKVRYEQATGMYKLGLISQNEARSMMGLEPLEMEIANETIAPAYIQGMPVRWSNYEADVERNLGNETPTPNGDGGKDNEPKGGTE